MHVEVEGLLGPQYTYPYKEDRNCYIYMFWASLWRLQQLLLLIDASYQSALDLGSRFSSRE